MADTQTLCQTHGLLARKSGKGWLFYDRTNNFKSMYYVSAELRDNGIEDYVNKQITYKKEAEERLKEEKKLMLLD